jgi:hypothetical protein
MANSLFHTDGSDSTMGAFYGMPALFEFIYEDNVLTAALFRLSKK